MSSWAYKKCATCGTDVHIGSLCHTCGGDPQGVIDRQITLEKEARERLEVAEKDAIEARKYVEKLLEHRVLVQARAQFIQAEYITRKVHGGSNERSENNQ